MPAGLAASGVREHRKLLAESGPDIASTAPFGEARDVTGEPGGERR